MEQDQALRIRYLLSAVVSAAAPVLALLIGRVAVAHGFGNTRFLDVMVAGVLGLGAYFGFVAGRSSRNFAVRAIGYLGFAICGLYCLVFAFISLFGLR
jgi:hypothetical protein